MRVLVINKTNNGKGIKDALKLLKENEFNVVTAHPLDVGLALESAYRLNCYIDECEKYIRDQYNELDEDVKTSILDEITSEYTGCSSQIFDYDYMDDIVRDAVSRVVTIKK